jgi:uncharacterized membrane protein
MRRMLTWARNRAADERGGVTTFVVIMVVPVVMMAGLAFDGGRILAGRREAIDVAQNAALAGAQEIDAAAVRRGQVAIDPAAVTAAAHAYLASTGHRGEVHVEGTEVIVRVTMVVDMQLLSAIGVGSRPVEGIGRSELVRGVDAAET